jgi:hypothetical protein
MRTDTNLQPNQAGKAKLTDAPPTTLVWYGGILGRTLFLIVLILITAKVASPQIERLSSIYETPGDLIRVLMGVGVCGWFIMASPKVSSVVARMRNRKILMSISCVLAAKATPLQRD